MATTTFMALTDQNGSVLLGESMTPVFNPYSKSTVKQPVEVSSLGGETEQTFNFSTQSTGTGAGKVVFDPFFVTKRVDSVSQSLFITQCTGAAYKFVDLLLVPGSNTVSPARPYLSYRLGLVGVADISTNAGSGDEAATETVKFEFATLQIGYQIIKSDGTLGTFAPVGWDRVRNVKI